MLMRAVRLCQPHGPTLAFSGAGTSRNAPGCRPRPDQHWEVGRQPPLGGGFGSHIGYDTPGRAVLAIDVLNSVLASLRPPPASGCSAFTAIVVFLPNAAPTGSRRGRGQHIC